MSAMNTEVNPKKFWNHRLIKTQIGHARDFAWYRGQRPSPARVILSHERVQIHARENLCSYVTNPPHFRMRELLLCDILITRAGDGRWPRYQAKSLAFPGCVWNIEKIQERISSVSLHIINFRNNWKGHYVMHSSRTGNKSHRPISCILRYGQLKVAYR